MATNIQHVLWTLLDYLKTIILALFTIPSKLPTPPPQAAAAANDNDDADDDDNAQHLARIASLAADPTNEPAARLQAMIATLGAGTWPPRFPSNTRAWPAPLRAYLAAYRACAPHLSAAVPSTCDAANTARRAAFRARMDAELHARVDVAAAVALLSTKNDENEEETLPWALANALLALVALSRHAYRWALIPAVRVAQRETRIAYPPALAAPWPLLQRRYGFGGGAGGALSNFLCNWDDASSGGGGGGPVCWINDGGRDAAIRRTEYWFAWMFVETERRAVGVYAGVVACLAAWERGEREGVLEGLGRVRRAVREVVRVLYETLVEDKVGREVWLGWVQGFHAYGAGEVVGRDGKEEEEVIVEESDGVSGNQLPFFQVVDAFLGLGPYLEAEEMRTSVPVAQRRLVAEVRKRCFRGEARERGDAEVEAEMVAIARQVRVWRAAHRVRIVPYLSQPAPERMLMMAGKSVLETKGVRNIKAAIDYLDYLVGRRIGETK